MKKPFQKTRAALERAVTIEMLPPLVPRPLASDFSLLTIRTLQRAEARGELQPVKEKLARGHTAKRTSLAISDSHRARKASGNERAFFLQKKTDPAANQVRLESPVQGFSDDCSKH